MKKINIDKKALLRSGEIAEAGGYELLNKLISRLIRGLYIFKTRKGEILSGSATFYIVMSFGPMILLIIILYAKIVGNVDVALEHVLSAIQTNIPDIAPWILKSITKIISAQLSGNGVLNWVNIVILGYGCLGFTASLNFGMNIISKTESSGGVFFDEFKSIVNGAFIGIFLITFLIFTSGLQIFEIYLKNYRLYNIIEFLVKYGIFQSIFSLSFFTFFYKWISPSKVRLIDAILGALSFLALFVLGKSFYWIYMHYMKKDFIISYGNFYTLIIALVWIYYLICSFYFGASVALAPLSLRHKKTIMIEPPAIPTQSI